MARDKLIQRRVYDILSNRPLMAFFTVSLLILSSFQIYGIYLMSTGNIVDVICEKHYCSSTDSASGSCEPIDVVYTWVNGSDPIWLAEMKRYANIEGLTGEDDYDPSRYDDKQELKYSLRSLDLYAPWVRYVYVVTAGQLPWWLDAQNPRLKVVSHRDIIPAQYLPTFSSPAIECFLHKIPGLSEKFLYLNDDIFFGGPVYLGDFYTQSEGYEVYTAWNVPECALGCPWSFLGDRSCDSACNIVECDYDGGDCLGDPKSRYYGAASHLDYLGDYFDSPFFDEEDLQDYQSVGKYPGFDEPPFDPKVVQARQHEDQDLLNSLRPGHQPNLEQIKIVKREIEEQFWKPMDAPNDEEVDSVPNKNTMRSLKMVVGSNERINLSDVNKISSQELVNDSSKEEPNGDNETPKQLILEELKKSEVNVSGAVHHFNKNYLKHNKKTRRRSKESIMQESSPKDDRKLAMYARSLIHTNKLFNKEYGFLNRKVPAHVPFLLEKTIVSQMQEKFKENVEQTALNKFRRPNDLQFAFAYYYYLLSERREYTIEEIFDMFDTDKSGTWSDREVRTVLARVRGLPLTAEVVHALEAALRTCERPEHALHPTPPGERYLDSDMPTITKSLVTSCPALSGPLRASVGLRPPLGRPRPAAPRHTFAMLDSNVTKAVAALDEIRRETKKFICINDNLDPLREEENAIVRMLLQELYEALLPLPSSLELPPGVANRFLRLSDLQMWQDGRRSAWLGLSLCAAVLSGLSLYHCNCFKRSLHAILSTLSSPVLGV